MNSMKRRAIETQKGTVQVINETTTPLSAAARGQLPNIEEQRKVIRRARNVNSHAPANPLTSAELTIPQELREYERAPDDNVRFLLADSGATADRILIFGTDEFADIMERSDHWYGDGTFSVAPSLFSQVYTILVANKGGVLPVLYCLLPNKLQSTYDHMFAMIKQIRPGVSPLRFSCDFEKGAMNSVEAAFPYCHIFGCFFHLVKNLKKKVAQEGLLPRYNTDANFALQARMISSLAFVPIADLDAKIDDLGNLLEPDLQPVLSYFEDTYAGRQMRGGGGRRAPLFRPAIWNVYDRTLANDPRTNNHSEAAHRRLQTEMGVDHPTVWKFIEALRKVQKGRDIYYESLVRGDAPPQKLQKYRLADARILTIVNDYPNRTTEEYLRGIAHNYQMNV